MHVFQGFGCNNQFSVKFVTISCTVFHLICQVLEGDNSIALHRKRDYWNVINPSRTCDFQCSMKTLDPLPFVAQKGQGIVNSSRPFYIVHKMCIFLFTAPLMNSNG